MDCGILISSRENVFFHFWVRRGRSPFLVVRRISRSGVSHMPLDKTSEPMNIDDDRTHESHLMMSERCNQIVRVHPLVLNNYSEKEIYPSKDRIIQPNHIQCDIRDKCYCDLPSSMIFIKCDYNRDLVRTFHRFASNATI